MKNFSAQDIHGAESVIFKETLFDPQKNKALIRAVVVDESLNQTIWIKMALTQDLWHIGLESGQNVIPTQGVGQALEEVYRAAKRTVAYSV